jgi:hypothetical protein
MSGNVAHRVLFSRTSLGQGQELRGPRASGRLSTQSPPSLRDYRGCHFDFLVQGGVPDSLPAGDLASPFSGAKAFQAAGRSYQERATCTSSGDRRSFLQGCFLESIPSGGSGARLLFTSFSGEEGEFRPVIDLSVLNMIIDCPHFKMETVRSVRQAVREI